MPSSIEKMPTSGVFSGNISGNSPVKGQHLIFTSIVKEMSLSAQYAIWIDAGIFGSRITPFLEAPITRVYSIEKINITAESIYIRDTAWNGILFANAIKIGQVKQCTVIARDYIDIDRIEPKTTIWIGFDQQIQKEWAVLDEAFLRLERERKQMSRVIDPYLGNDLLSTRPDHVQERIKGKMDSYKEKGEEIRQVGLRKKTLLEQTQSGENLILRLTTGAQGPWDLFILGQKYHFDGSMGPGKLEWKEAQQKAIFVPLEESGDTLEGTSMQLSLD